MVMTDRQVDIRYPEEFHDEVPLGGGVELINKLQQSRVAESSHQSELSAESQLLLTRDSLLANDLQRERTTHLSPAANDRTSADELGTLVLAII